VNKVSLEILILLRQLGKATTIGGLCASTGKTDHMIRGIVTALREEGLVAIDRSQAPYLITLTRGGVAYKLPGESPDPIVRFMLKCPVRGTVSKHCSRRCAWDALDRDQQYVKTTGGGPYPGVGVYAKHRSGQTTGPIPKEEY